MTIRSVSIAGLDIGTTKVTLLAADLITELGSQPKLNITGIGSSSSLGIRKGVVINIDATVQAIAAALQQAEAMAGKQIKEVYASISGNHLKSFNSNGIVAIRDREVSRSDVEKVIEAARAVAIPLDREILHVLPQEFIIDDQDGIKEPLGISGVRLEAKVHIVTGSIASAQNVVKCANRCGLTVADIVLAPYAAAKSVMTEEEQDLGVCVLDIGGGTTDLVVFRQGSVRYSSVIPVGGNHITNDIANILRTPVASAEILKCKYGSAMFSDDDSDLNINVTSTGGREARNVSKHSLVEVIQPRVAELFQLAINDLTQSGQTDLLAGGIILTGGTSLLTDIGGLAEQIFKLPVRVGRPSGFGGLTDLVDSPEYSAATGLVKYAAQIGAVTHWSPRTAARFGGILNKVGNWLTRHF